MEEKRVKELALQAAKIRRTALEAINAAFPHLARINLYANGSSIALKSEEELRRLRALRLHTLYVGLESGSQNILDVFSKSESVEEMIDPRSRHHESGKCLSGSCRSRDSGGLPMWPAERCFFSCCWEQAAWR